MNIKSEILKEVIEKHLTPQILENLKERNYQYKTSEFQALTDDLQQAKIEGKLSAEDFVEIQNFINNFNANLELLYVSKVSNNNTNIIPNIPQPVAPAAVVDPTIEPETMVDPTVTPEKEKKSYRNLWIGLGLAAIIGAGVGGCHYLNLQKEEKPSIEKEKEEEFSINNIESVKNSVSNQVEEAFAKGENSFGIAEWLDFTMVANTKDVNPAKVFTYFYKDERSASDIIENFQRVVKGVYANSLTSKNNKEILNVSNMFGKEADKVNVSKIQNLISKLTDSILNNSKGREEAVSELNKFISDLYNTNAYENLSDSANYLIINLIHAAHHLDNGIMAKTTRINIFGDANCEMQTGSIYDKVTTNFKKDFEQKYSDIREYFLNAKTKSGYDAFIALVKKITNPVYVAITGSIKDIQLKAKNIPKEVTSGKKVVTTVTTSKTTNTPKPATKEEAKKLEEAKTALPKEIVKSIVSGKEMASDYATLDIRMNSKFVDRITYENFNLWYEEGLKALKNDSKALEEFKKFYWLKYNEGMKQVAYVLGQTVGEKEAVIDSRNANAKFDVNVLAAEALVNRTTLLNLDVFITPFKQGIMDAYKNRMEVELKKIQEQKAKDGVIAQVNQIVVESNEPNQIITGKDSKGEFTKVIDTLYDIYYYGDHEAVSLSANVADAKWIKVVDAQAQGITEGYIFEYEGTKVIPIKVKIPPAKTK